MNFNLYSYLFFSFGVVGLFSLVQNLKDAKRVSSFKVYLILTLVIVTLLSFLFFLDEVGVEVSLFISIFRLLGIIFLANIFYLMASSQISIYVIFFEIFLFITYIIFFLQGEELPEIRSGLSIVNLNNFHRVYIFITVTFFHGAMFYNLWKIHKKTDRENLYHRKLLRWSHFLFFAAIIMALYEIFSIYFFRNTHLPIRLDTRILFLLIIFLVYLLVLFRPPFIDDFGIAYRGGEIEFKVQRLSNNNFDFLFFSNQYYLNPDANIRDFALRLNHSVAEVSSFIEGRFNMGFIALTTEHRVVHFTNLLKSKMHERFTIEALSEMSGFGNRQSMYNAFKKHVGCSPTEFINSL